MSLAIQIIFSVCAFLLSACATTSQPPGVPFQAIEPPPPGQARIYVLRPKFSAEQTFTSLSLSIDGTAVAALEPDQFYEAAVEPGIHLISLSPGLLDGEIWRKQLSLEAKADSTYFLAYWPITEPRTGLQIIPMPGLVPVVVVPQQGSRTTGVQFEQVPEEHAMSALTTLVKTPRVK